MTEPGRTNRETSAEKTVRMQMIPGAAKGTQPGSGVSEIHTSGTTPVVGPVRAASSHPSISSASEPVAGLPIPSRSPYLLVEDVADRLHCSVRKVHGLTSASAIPHRRLPGSRRCLFLVAELEAWEGGAALVETKLAGGGRIVRPK